MPTSPTAPTPSPDWLAYRTADADATDAPWWWIGFAWSHAGDLVPMLAGDYSDEVLLQLTYRTWAQVHDDVEALARELASLPKRADR
jgi:hypothetical protein